MTTHWKCLPSLKKSPKIEHWQPVNKQPGSLNRSNPTKTRSERLRLQGLVCRHCRYTSDVKWKVWTPIIYSEKWLKEDIYIRHRAWRPPPQSQLPPCPLEQKMCFPNENKLRPASLRQLNSGIWDQIKTPVAAEKRNEIASEERCTG